MLTLPKKVDKDTLHDIENRFDKIFCNLDQNKISDVKTNARGRIKSLKNARSSWLVNLAIYSEAMYTILEDPLDQDGSIFLKDEKYMIAALYYLIDIDDVIPDHVLGDGYLDDAHVINLCLKKISRDYRNRIYKHVEIITIEYQKK